MIFFAFLSTLFLLVSCGKDDVGNTDEICGQAITSVHFECTGGTDIDYLLDGYFSPDTCGCFAWYKSTRASNTAEAAYDAPQKELQISGASEVSINEKTVFAKGAAPVVVEIHLVQQERFMPHITPAKWCRIPVPR